MPIYEYQCSKCGHQLESFQKMSEAPLIECPECHQSSLQKLVSSVGFQLKGTGWYATDFKNKDKPESPKNSVDNPNTTSSSPPKEDKITGSTGSTSGGKTE